MTTTTMKATTLTFLKYIALFLIILLISVNVFLLQRRHVHVDETFLLSNMKKEFKKSQKQQQQQRQQHRQLLHEGRTLRDTLQRILSRKITASNVLIITPDVPAAVPSADTTTTTTVSTTNNANVARRPSAAGLLVSKFANKEGHSIHMLHPHINVDSWWKNDHDNKNQNWFLLAFVSDGRGDLLWRHRNNNINNQTTPDELLEDIGDDDVDHLMNSVNIFLTEATVTYLILEVGVLPGSSSSSSNNNNNNNGHPKIIGRHAVQILHDYKYKVQVLVNSHYMTAQWGPNTLLTPYNIDNFFQDAENIVGITGEPFQSYLFATQGLDLAIPFSARGGADAAAFWDYDTATRSSCSGGSGSGSGDVASMLSSSSNKDCGNGNCGIYANIGLGIRPPCPLEHSKSKIEFVSNANRNGDISNNSLGLKLMYDNKIITSQTEGVSIWLNDMENPERAEAACMRMEPNASTKINQPSVACTTRIIKQQIQQETKQNKGSTSKPTSSPYNVLSILIDPISRTQFLRSLPRTAALLEAKQFARFDKYTVVGANSGPNQAALFSGVPLMNGRNGISSSASHGNGGSQLKNNARKTQWIWDELRSSGFVTFKAEDGCIENSNMIQSLSPNVTHGGALHQMFCFSYDRPNCLGSKLAATHLLDTAVKFIDAYSASDDRWAAFLSFTDSHEDSLSMIQILDDVLFDFISNLDTSNTLVMILSDHGLHYGPHFQTPAGVKERAQPVLYMHLPDELQSLYAETLQNNSKLWTSHFDVHETMLDVALGTKGDSGIIGSSLLHPLPNDRSRCHGVRGIPSEYCDVVDDDDTADAANAQLACTNMPTPPSPLTFLADLPTLRQLKCDQGTKGMKFPTSLPQHISVTRSNLRQVQKQSVQMSGSCKCATDTAGWHDCQQHPWNIEKEPKGGIALTFCEGGSHGGNFNDIYSNPGVVEVDIGIPAMVSQRLKSRSLENVRIQDQRGVAVSQLSTVAMLADSNQFLQRQMLCADSIVSNLRVNSPPPVSWRIHSF